MPSAQPVAAVTTPWVTLRGSLDLEGSRAVDVRFHAGTAARRHPVVVDLSGVDTIASLGIGMLIACAVSLRRHRERMVILRPAAAVEQVLLHCRVTEVIPIAGTDEQAIALVRSSSPASAG